MKVLFVDSCMRVEEMSRTKMLCNAFLKAVEAAHPDYEIETLVLKEQDLRPYQERDVNERNDAMEAGDMDHPKLRYAIQFASADRILIGAPYWDLSFPSTLRVYIENIFANGIAFKYEGPKSVGLCKAEKLMFIQSAGGFVGDNEPGPAYMKAVCDMLGIGEFQYICGDGLDIQEIPQEPRIKATLDKIETAASVW